MQNKQSLRKDMLQRLKSQKEETRQRKNSLIAEKLFQLQEFQNARTVMFYVSLDYEVGTREMIARALEIGKTVLVPVISCSREMIASRVMDMEQELEKGPYGIPQPGDSWIRPIAKDKIDLVVVPGLAFDCEGRRLGRGKGYYDSFLKDIPSQIPLLGLAYDFQVVENLPVLPHDIPVTKLVTA